MSVGEENKRPPPKPLAFGEFLIPHRTQRRRKGRGCGQGAGTKPYSMHDNQWEESELAVLTEEAKSRKAEEAPSGALLEPPCSLSPEEDEDQWEDVSEEEEEEGGGGSTNPGLSSEDEASCRLSPVELAGPPWGVQSPAELPQGEETRPNTEQEALGKHEEAAGNLAEDGMQGVTAFPCQMDGEVAPGMVEIADFEWLCFHKNSPSLAGC